MATVELAYNAENKEFMAHPACQKWVTRQFYGDITPRELSWGLFKCPDNLKVRSEEKNLRGKPFLCVDYFQCDLNLSDVVLDQFLSHWSSAAHGEESHRLSQGDQIGRAAGRETRTIETTS